MRWLAVSVLAAMIAAPASHAALCGDDVDGQDVPCGCGDVVVSDVVLDGDPVVGDRCEGEGLIVRARTERGVTIDLAGATLRGDGSGTGLWVIEGGAGGANIVSSTGLATITGFRDGIMAHGPNTVALVDGVSVTASARDGVRVNTEDYEIRNTTSQNAGRDGFALAGKRFRVTSTRAEGSKRLGYFVMGAEGVLGAEGDGNVATGSGAHNFQIMGGGHHLVACEATGAGKDGVHVLGLNLEVRSCVANGNGGSGITGDAGGASTLAANQAIGNERNGIAVASPNAVDGGGNVGHDNRGARQQRPAIQCEIAGSPCRP